MPARSTTRLADGTDDPHLDANESTPLAVGLQKLTDMGLAVVIFFTPLFMGGRHPLGRFVFVVAVCATTLAWLASQSAARRARWNRSPAFWLIVAAVLLVGLQITPLPTAVIGRLSPSLSTQLPLWSAGVDSPAHLGEWNRVSLTPFQTQGGLMMLLTYGMLFIVVVNRLHGIKDVERLLRWIAIAACGMSVLGLAQFLFGNSKFLWVYEHPFRNTTGAVKGSFANQNHFAHFVALGIAPIIWWLHARRTTSSGRSKFGSPGHRKSHFAGYTPLLIAGLITAAVAGLLSFSRGGVIVMFLSAAFCVGVFAWHGFLGRSSLVALAGAGLLMVLALTIHGSEKLMARLGTLLPVESQPSPVESRKLIWDAVVEAIPSYAVFGSGVGSHREVYPQFIDRPADVEFTHAESGYLQLLLETGVPGILLMGIGIAIVVNWCWQSLRKGNSPQQIACGAAVTAGVLVSLVHAIGDFAWYIPACMSLTIILIAVACRLAQMSDQGEPTRWSVSLGRPVWMGGGAVATVASIAIVSTWWGPAAAAGSWESYRKLARETQSTRRLAPLDEALNEPFEGMLLELETTLKRDPNDARAHLRMAGLCRRRFEYLQQDSVNAMTLVQIRDAAVASQFASREALDNWLAAAIGPNRDWLDRALHHTRRALELCPLQGEGYVFLAELTFLEGGDPLAKRDYINQALRLRPQNSAVLLAAGSELALAGNAEAAIDMWKRAFQNDDDSQRRLIELLGPMAPAEFFVEHFTPDRVAGFRLYNLYRTSERKHDAEVMATRLLEQLSEEIERSPQSNGDFWMQSRTLHAYLGNQEKALECIRQAVEEDPGNFNWRREFANQLLQSGRNAEAVEEFKWCLSRTPNDESLKRQLFTATKLMHDGTAAHAADGGTSLRRR